MAGLRYMCVREQLETRELRKVAYATGTELQAEVTEHSSSDLKTLSAMRCESGPQVPTPR